MGNKAILAGYVDAVRPFSISIKAILLASALVLAGSVFVLTMDSEDMDADGTSQTGTWYNLDWWRTWGGELHISGEGTMKEPGTPGSESAYRTYSWYYCGYTNEITSLIIHEGVTTISAGSFSDYFPNLSKIKIPASVESIGDGAFKGKTITNLTFPEGSKLTKIGSKAFMDCTSLKTFQIPDGVESIGSYAFSGCKDLIGPLDIPSCLTSIGAGAFEGCSNLQGGIVSKNTIDLSFAVSAFKGCSSLTVLDCPLKFLYVGSSTFEGCSSLEGNATIDGSCMGVGSNAFKGCSKLAITLDFTGHSWIPPFVNESAFEGCTGLTSVNIYGGSVKEKAFAGCTGLKQVTLGASFDEFNPSAFEGVQFFDENGDEIVVTEQTKTKLYGSVFEGSGGKLYFLENTDEDMTPDDSNDLNVWMIATPVALIVGILIGAFAMKMRRP